MLGRSISHYKIISKLGEGGMGVVYEALDLRLNRPVALKFLHPDLVNSREQVAALEQEARAISALNHPNIATIYGMEEVEAQKFLVLEYLPGGTLKSKLSHLHKEKRQLAVDEALDLAIQICDGLAHAHEHGIIHRDIKHSNVLFTAAGNVKIADFSIARPTEGPGSGPTSEIMGTPPFMSPEQAQGKDIDHRSDIFSFGIVLFELLTGQLPFQGARAALMLHEIVHTPAPPLAKFRAGIPNSVQSIVSKALEKNRDDRYQSCRQLCADLRSARKDVDTAQHLDTLDTVTLAPAPRSKRLGWKAAAALLLIAGFATVIAVPAIRQTAAQWLHLYSIPAEKRLAVLMFTNAGASPEFSDGLMEVLSSKLSQVEQFQGSLVVISPSEVRKAEVKTPSDARKTFGATLAITGTVRKSGGRMEVMINLVDTQTLTHLRSTSVETDYPDAAALQDGIVAKVTEMLDIALAPQEVLALQAGNTHVAGAYRYYVEGRGFLQHDDAEKAIAVFQQAIQLDPKYALAYAGLGEAWLWKFKRTKDPQAIDEAFRNCSHAVELNGSVALVRVTLGLVLISKGKYEDAEREFQEALKIDPVDAEAYRGLAQAYEHMGRRNKAEETYKKAIELRPNDWTGYRDLGKYYYNSGALKEAEPYYRRVIQLTGGNGNAYNDLGAIYMLQHRYAEAAAMFQKSLALKPTSMTLSNLGSLYYFQGRYKEAGLYYEKAVALTGTNASLWGNLADAYRWTPESAGKAPGAYRNAILFGEQELTANPRDSRLRSRIAYYYAALAEKDKALAEISQAIRISPSDGYVLFHSALVYEENGDRNRALQALRAAVQAKFPIEQIRTAQIIKDLREDPRYASMVDPEWSNLRPGK